MQLEKCLDQQLVQSMLLLFNLSLSLIKRKFQGYSDGSFAECRAKKKKKPQYGKAEDEGENDGENDKELDEEEREKNWSDEDVIMSFSFSLSLVPPIAFLSSELL